jgi:hypothetical protein
MILDNTSKTVEVVLGEAHATNPLEVNADYADTQFGAASAPASVNTVTNGTSAVTVAGSPPASVQRSIMLLTVFNADTIDHLVIIRSFDGTNRRRYIQIAVPVGATLAYLDNEGWSVIPSFVPGQIIGTSTNDDAAPGNIGEEVDQAVPVGSALALTSGAALNVCSITLSAGDWDVDGFIRILPASGTTVSNFLGGVSTMSGSLPATELGFSLPIPFTGTGTISIGIPCGRYRISLASSTPVYLVSRTDFAVSTCSTWGAIQARRAR